MDSTQDASDLDSGQSLKRSCTFCKRRKIKCNREHPCSSCIKFKNPSCVYLPPKASKPKIHKTPKQTLEQELQQLRSKVRQLEADIDNRTNENPESRNGLGYGFKRVVEEDAYDLNNAEHAQFDQTFKDLLKMIEEHDCDDDFTLFFDGGPLVDTEPSRRRHYGILSWKAYSLTDPALKKLGALSRYKLSKGELKGFFNTDSSELDLKNTTKFHDIMGDVVQPLNDEVASESAKDDLFATRVMMRSAAAARRQRQLDQEKLKAQKNGTKDHLKDASTSSPFPDSQSAGGRTNRIRMGSGVKPLMILRRYQTGSSTENSIRDQLALKKAIEDFLPAKDIIWKYVDVFFENIYIFVPVIDELDFRRHIHRLLEQGGSTEKCPDLKMTNKSDFAHLGVLLFVLRLGYLSLLPTTTLASKRKSWHKNSPEKRSLLESPVDLEAVSLAHECVNLFNIFGPINLTIFQLLLVTRLYTLYGPECGDGPDYGDAALLNAVLFQVAYSLGIHRDPDKLSVYKDERMKNLIRKMWATLLSIDLSHALEYGDPLNANKYSYDTKLPVFHKDNANLINLSSERDVVNCYNFLSTCFKPLTSFVTELTDVNGTTKVSSLCKKLRYLRFKLYEDDGLISKLVPKLAMSDPNLTNAVKYKVQFSFSYFICSIFFHMFLYFEKKQCYDVAFYYLSNLTQKILLVLFPYYYKINDPSTETSSLDFILVPGVEAMLHKSMLFTMSMIVRVKHQLLRMSNRYDHEDLMKHDEKYQSVFEKLNSLHGKFIEVNGIFSAIANCYSQRYYYSWIVSRFNRFLGTIVEEEEFDSVVYNPDVAYPILDSEERLTKLIDVIDLCLESKKKFSTAFSNDAGDTADNMEVDGTYNSATTSGTTSTYPGQSSSNSNSGPPTVSAGQTLFQPTDFGSPFKEFSFGQNSFPPPFNIGSTGMNFGATPGSTGGSSDSGSNTFNPVNPEDVDNIWLSLLGKEMKPAEEGINGIQDNPQVSAMYPDPIEGFGLPTQSQDGAFGVTVDSVLYDELFRGL